MSAAALRALHVPGDPLVLPNAWDAGSARLVAAAGFPAVATTSSGVADALGHADGHDAPVDAVLGVAARIARAVDVPVTADMEGGYGLAPQELAERLAAAGAVGLNLEDTDHPSRTALKDATAHAAYLEAVGQAATSSSTPASTSTSAARAARRTPWSAPAATSPRARTASIPSGSPTSATSPPSPRWARP